ncbi:MAG: hypothetical protein AB7Q00_16270 [Phycisphaerales bacterium]
MRYIIVRVTKNCWIVAEKRVLDSEYTGITRPVPYNTARSICDDLNILGKPKPYLQNYMLN